MLSVSLVGFCWPDSRKACTTCGHNWPAVCWSTHFCDLVAVHPPVLVSLVVYPGVWATVKNSESLKLPICLRSAGQVLSFGMDSTEMATILGMF
jgi:hypothetical protein